MNTHTFKDGKKLDYNCAVEIDFDRCRTPKYIGEYEEYDDYGNSYINSYDVVFMMCKNINPLDKNDLWFIGYETVPHMSDKPRHINNVIKYWFNGSSNSYKPLCILYNIGDKMDARTLEAATIKKHANAPFLNDIRAQLIEMYSANMNVNIKPSMATMNKQYGKEINIYKRNLKRLFIDTGIEQFTNELRSLLDIMQANFMTFYKFIIMKNRYWWMTEFTDISPDAHLTDYQIALIVYFQDYFGMQMTQLYMNKHTTLLREYILDRYSMVHTERNDEFIKIIKDSYTNICNQNSVIKTICCVKYARSNEDAIDRLSVALHRFIRQKNEKIFN